MENNGSIKFLRGTHDNSSGKTLKEGQPVYITDKNYLVIGDGNNKQASARPVDTTRVRTYLGDWSNNAPDISKGTDISFEIRDTPTANSGGAIIERFSGRMSVAVHGKNNTNGTDLTIRSYGTSTDTDSVGGRVYIRADRGDASNTQGAAIELLAKKSTANTVTDTINFLTNDSTGVINVGTSTIKPTVNINSTTTNIGGAVRIGNANDRRILIAYTTTTTIRGNTIQLWGNNNATINLKQSGEIDVGESDSAQAVKINLNAPTHVKNTLTTGNIIAVADSLYDIGDSDHKYNNAYINELNFKKKDASVDKLSTVIDNIEKNINYLTLGLLDSRITSIEPGTIGEINKSSTGYKLQFGEYVLYFIHHSTTDQGAGIGEITRTWTIRGFNSPFIVSYNLQYVSNFTSYNGIGFDVNSVAAMRAYSASVSSDNDVKITLWNINSLESVNTTWYLVILDKIPTSSTTSETSTIGDSTGGSGGGGIGTVTPGTK